MRADLERGRVGLGYVLNSLRNGPVDAQVAHRAVMALVAESSDQVVATLAERIDERTGSLSGTVIDWSLRLEDLMGRQHQGLIPISHRILGRLKSAVLGRRRDGGHRRAATSTG